MRTAGIDCVVFDSFGTLFDLGPLGQRLEELRLPGDALKVWFARLLRDSFALEVAGAFKPFKDIARGALEVLAAERGVSARGDRIDDVLGTFSRLPAFPDAGAALERVRRAGAKIALLSNGARALAEELLEREKLRTLVDVVASAEESKHFKPHPETYLRVARALGLAPKVCGFVSAHAWDIHGASAVGFRTGWVSRLEKQFQPQLGRPDVVADSLDGVVQRLLQGEVGAG